MVSRFKFLVGQMNRQLLEIHIWAPPFTPGHLHQPDGLSGLLCCGRGVAGMGGFVPSCFRFSEFLVILSAAILSWPSARGRSGVAC
jgi:hypothetical protein